VRNLRTRVDYLESKRLSEGSTEKPFGALCSSPWARQFHVKGKKAVVLLSQ
jgi:hypothetical protein